MKNRILIAMLILIVVAFCGCDMNNASTTLTREEQTDNVASTTLTREEQTGNVTSTTLTGEEQTGNVASTTLTGEEQTDNVASDLPEDKDWKVITGKDTLYKMSYDRGTRCSHSLEGDKTVEYSLSVPGSWTLDGIVLYDSNNKIAEMEPVVLLGRGEEEQFLDYKPGEEKVISQESISVAEYKGTKVIIQTDTESGSWYPHIYMLSDGTLGFTFNLYSHNEIQNEDEEKLFDEIVQTIKFKQIT